MNAKKTTFSTAVFFLTLFAAQFSADAQIASGGSYALDQSVIATGGATGTTGGATDAGYANRNGKAIVVESFGLAGLNMHAHDEYIDTVSIVPRLYLMTRMLIEQGKKP